MAINKTIKLSWHGVEYSTSMTMRLVEKIEEHINLGVMVQQCSVGDLRFSKAARLIELVLQDAGAYVTAEEVFEGLFSGGEDIKGTVDAVTAILSTIFPEPKKKPTVSKKAKAKT